MEFPINHLSAGARKSLASILQKLVRARKQAHEVLLAQADDVLDVALRSNARRLSPRRQAAAVQKKDKLLVELDAALRTLQAVARMASSLCPPCEEWGHLAEIRFLTEGQRMVQYKKALWKREIIEPMKEHHQKVLAEIRCFRQNLMKRKDGRGAPPKYPNALKHARRLLRQTPNLKDNALLRLCKDHCRQHLPTEAKLLPDKPASFMRSFRRWQSKHARGHK
jgi:hypothetical protein